MSEFMQLLSTKSMIRYLPAKITAGLARSSERMLRRSPWPPARMSARTCFTAYGLLAAGPSEETGRRVLRGHVPGECVEDRKVVAQVTGDQEMLAHVLTPLGAHAVGNRRVLQEVLRAIGALRGRVHQ